MSVFLDFSLPTPKLFELRRVVDFQSVQHFYLQGWEWWFSSYLYILLETGSPSYSFWNAGMWEFIVNNVKVLSKTYIITFPYYHCLNYYLSWILSVVRYSWGLISSNILDKRRIILYSWLYLKMINIYTAMLVIHILFGKLMQMFIYFTYILQSP